MKKYLVLFLVNLLTVPAFAADVESGKQIATGQCIACHGADGNSANPEWPKLAGQHAKYLVKQLQNFKTGAQNASGVARNNAQMGPLAMVLSEQDMKNVAAFYAGQSITKKGVKEEYIESGRKLYFAGNADKGIPACTACHGPTGDGLASANYPTLAGQHAKYTTLQMKAFQSGARANDPNRIMRDIAEKMSDKEIEAIAHFLEGLH